MTLDEVVNSWPLILATVGPVATVGAIYATFQRLRDDFKEHKSATAEGFKELTETTSEEFRRSRLEFAGEVTHLREELSGVRDRLSKIEGVCIARHQ
jgi:hypothetical protein